NPIIDRRSIGMKSLLSLSSIFSSADEESEATKNFCQAFRLLNIVDAQKQHDDSTTEIDNTSDHTESPSLSMIESLPSAPLNDECTDSQVSAHFHGRAEEFMRRNDNRPGLESVWLEKNSDGLEVYIDLFPSNVAFYDLANLGLERFKRTTGIWGTRTLKVTLTGLEDPIAEQLADFLSTSIKHVEIEENGGRLSSSDLYLCLKLLGESTIEDLRFRFVNLDYTMTPHVISILSRATKYVYIAVNKQPQFNDPAAFVQALYSSPVGDIGLFNHRSPLFFGLPRAFWERFLNENLSNGSFEWVETSNIGLYKKFRMAPIKLPDSPTVWLRCKKPTMK
ncbi:hypothetical protein PMAYCL1PPCAC_27954, partial [Pristionchus mayeri]